MISKPLNFLTRLTTAAVLLLLAVSTGHAADPLEDPKEVKQARREFDDGKYDEALKILAKARESNHKLLPPRIILAKWLLDNKQGSNARLQIELAGAAEPENPAVFLFNGLIADIEGRHMDARLNCETALKLAGTIKDANQRKDIQREAYAGLSKCAEAMNQWQAARDHIEKWLELDPTNSLAHMAYGRALFKTGKPEKAAYDQLVEAGRLQAAADKKAGREEPSLEIAEISMARLWGARESKNAAEASENSRKAEEWFGKATQAATEKKDKARVQLAYAEWLLNTAEGKEDKLKDALKHAEHARDLLPGLAASRRTYGSVLRALGDYGAAERLFEGLHQDDLTDVDAANQLVLVLLESSQSTSVKRGLQLAHVNARQYPRSPEILATLGWACYRVKDVDNAERYLRLSVSSGPATQDTLYYLATVLSERRRQLQDAKPADWQKHAADLDRDIENLLKTAVDTKGLFMHRKDAQQRLDDLKKSRAKETPARKGP